MAEVVAREFRAMGSPARVVVAGVGSDVLNAAVSLIDEMEARWSRFRPDSEIAQLNAATGSVVVVSELTYALVSRAAEAEQLTSGRFNPFMLTQLERLGYQYPWQDHPAGAGQFVPHPARAGIDLFPAIRGLRLPVGVRFDPGGIGKGLAVDLVVERLLDAGATTAMVDIGGDLRVEGDPWYDDRWRVAVENPLRPGEDLAQLVPDSGAVATSSRLRRAWVVEGRSVHHLLDPANGLPAATDLVTATACSSQTWWADVVAKVALMAGTRGAAGLAAEYRTPVLAVATDGTVVRALLPDPVLPAAVLPAPRLQEPA